MKPDKRAHASILGKLLESRWCSTLLLVSLIVLYAAWIGYQWRRNKLYDFNLYYIASAGFRRGVDVYAMAREYGTVNAANWAALADTLHIEYYAPPYRYPPLTAQIVLPLTYLDPRLAGMIWLTLTAAAFVLSAWQMGAISPLREGRALAFALMIVFVPALTTMHAGQINGLVLLALVVGMVGLAKHNGFAAGIGVAVSALLKLVPSVLLLYLFWRRQWRAGLIGVATLTILMLTAPVTLTPAILPSYLRNFLVMGQPGVLFAMPPNQSLNGVWARLLQDVMPASAIYRVYLLSAVLMIAATIAVCWPMRTLPQYWRFEYALIVCALQMITPYAWYHQLVLLYIPLEVTAEQLWKKKRWVWLGIILALLILTDIHGLAWHRFEGNRWVTSFPFIFNAALWISLTISILDARRNGSPRRTQTVAARAEP